MLDERSKGFAYKSPVLGQDWIRSPAQLSTLESFEIFSPCSRTCAGLEVHMQAYVNRHSNLV